MRRVVLVDDSEALRALVRIRLEEAPVVVVAEAGDGAGALEHGTAPEVDCVVLDANLPDGSGVDVARRLTAARPGLDVLLYSGFVDEQLRVAALDAGCAAVFSKDDLVALVARVAAGPD